MNPTLLIGIAGAALTLIAFLMNQLHRWSQDALKYDLCNACGGLLLTLYAALLSSVPFLILNSTWFLFSLRDVWRDLRSRKKL